MKKDHQILSHLQPVQASPYLFEKIMTRIQLEQQKALASVKRRFIFFSFLAATTIGLFFPVWAQFQDEMSQTGFSQFISLLSSDLNSLANTWQEFALSLLESFPFFSLTLLLSVLFLLLSSFKFLARDIKNVFASSSTLPLIKT